MYSSDLQAALTRFGLGTDRVGKQLSRADALVIASGPKKDEAAYILATAYVLLAAALERLVKDSLEATILEIAASGTKVSDLVPSMVCLFISDRFDALQDLRGLKMWSRRASIFDPVGNGDLVSGSAFQLPIDGRTLRKSHFETIWGVFGFPLPVLPRPQLALALEDLADGRNSVAHGVADPLSFGRAKLTGDVTKLLSLIEELGLHLVVTADEYLRTDAFSR